MSFVRLENLNDFIQPSTTCIKPIEKKTTGVVAKVNDVNLSDCLACSGCITSAESVLVQQQNYEELFKVINDNKSAQSIVSLAHKFSLDVKEAAERLSSFLVTIGCNKVFDINLARHLALVESYNEFQRRISEESPSLPVISSVCPGWICYAEKTNGDLLIPYLSKVRSPQQIMGSLVKKLYCDKESKSRNDIYHVTLMPCFDKKLESSREDFKDDDGIKDVDCVLTPLELEEILMKNNTSLLDFEPRALDILIDTGTMLDLPPSNHLGSVSGGYSESIILASSLGGLINSELASHISYQSLKNSDFIELNLNLDLTYSNGDKIIKPVKVAIVNGFRNIQTIVQRLKRKTLKYDYIEIMACPSGCINGGAQCRSNEGVDQNTTIEKTKNLYRSVPTIGLDLNDSSISELYKKLEIDTSQKVDDLLYTNFHSVAKMQNLSVNW